MIEITKADLRKRFEAYNQLYFKGRLKTPVFKFITAKSPYGSCHTKKDRCEIWMSKYTKWTDETLKNVLIHEMIHQYVYEVLHGCKYTLFPHGIRFCYVRWRLNKKYNLKINQIPMEE